MPMNKSQVFKVKGMHRDLSMPNASGEFAYEIVNMRVMPAEEGAGFSLTNERGLVVDSDVSMSGNALLGQCPTTDSLIVFSKHTKSDIDYIEKLYHDGLSWQNETLYRGNLNFKTGYPIEALFNYETEDIQKVYWIDGINQLRCINIADTSIIKINDDQQFNSVKEVSSLPDVSIERISGGSFTAGVIQYYITYFNEFMSESPIIYTSPLLYIAHDNRGAKTNDAVNTAFKLSLSNLNNTNWDYIRIYATHRTSLEATPEASIISEIKISNSTAEFIDFGSNRTSISPSDLYFTGGKYIKAGTMTVKDQVMFLGNLKIGTPDSIDHRAIQELFDSLRLAGGDYFRCNTRKSKRNDLKEYEDSYYKYDNQLNNTESITHFKYGEKYRFGISVMDKWGNWSNPIWIKDAFIEVPPEQVDKETLELPCPQLELDYIITTGKYINKSIYDALFTELGVVGIKPLVVYPDVNERKVLAQGVVCPTVYNLKDRKENGPYAQASWFMRPNAPVDLWGSTLEYHDSDRIYQNSRAGYSIFSKNSILNPQQEGNTWLDYRMSLVYDDLSIYQFYEDQADPAGYITSIKTGETSSFEITPTDAKDLIESGSWVEFRHNYALRTKGWTWGPTNDWYNWNFGIEDDNEWKHKFYTLAKEGTDIDSGDAKFIFRSFNSGIDGDLPKDTNGIVAIDHSDQDIGNRNRIIFYKFRLGGSRCAELDTSRFGATIPINRFKDNDLNRQTWRNIPLVQFNTGNSAYYVDNSIVTLNSPEIEMSDSLYNISLQGYNFRIIGAIPLTATISDISLVTEGGIYNPSANDEVSFGLKKVLVKNKNIGHHGFKGMVTHSMLYSGHNAPDNTYTFQDSGSIDGEDINPMHHDKYAAYFPLHPWQSTGNIPGFLPDWDNKNLYSKLKRKVLSNLRYSASTKYLPEESVSHLTDNCASLGADVTKAIGWKPFNGSSIQWYTSSDSSIAKLSLNGYNTDLIYSANIDSIATATSGENNDIPIPIYQYFYGRKLVPSPDLHYGDSTPYLAGAAFDDVYKTGIGSSIKYKSSPHAIIGFNNIHITIGETSKFVQDILPSFYGLNNDGRDLNTIIKGGLEKAGVLYEDSNIVSIPHQAFLYSNGLGGNFGLPGYSDFNAITKTPTYGWLWLGEIYKENDPTFGGDNEYALQNNKWEIAGISKLGIPSMEIPGIVTYNSGEFETTYKVQYINNSLQFVSNDTSRNAISFYLEEPLSVQLIKEFMLDPTRDLLRADYTTIIKDANSIGIKEATCNFKFITNSNSSKADVIITLPTSLNSSISDVFLIDIPTDIFKEFTLRWTQGDTYYQRFDTLKTYAYSDKDENSIVDITSFMVETRVNIDGRTDRNRGQESNLQMSPENFNLMNDVYSQKDNLFTYRILDDDVQKRTDFPNQITWSLSKTAGETIDKWLNITLASVMDLDGTKGKLTALKTFSNNLIAFQDKGISHVLFNSRVQIPTSEYVPIQIANSGKVDGQQYLTTDLGCQDKWNIVTTPSGLYFVDYYSKSIYRFNGKVEDLSTVGGFRGWCDDNLTDWSTVLGYYDRKNKEVLFYGNSFGYTNGIATPWLGFSEITNTFSSFYTFPKAALSNVRDRQIWLVYDGKYNENEAKYENVYTYYSDVYGKSRTVPESSYPYGLTAIVRQDSNIVKTFNSVEFRADTYRSFNLQNDETFDTIQIEDEYNGKTSESLEHKKYKPSNLKKLLRTWRAYIPRPKDGNKTKRYVNQWAKVGLWKTKSTQEKTVLHDMAVWYSE